VPAESVIWQEVVVPAGLVKDQRGWVEFQGEAGAAVIVGAAGGVVSSV
jgi:hypothetical protein